MTTGELAESTGLPPSRIRYWEKIGVLPKPSRISGRRRYGADAVHRLAVLRLERACGFRLDEMRHLLHGFNPLFRRPAAGSSLPAGTSGRLITRLHA